MADKASRAVGGTPSGRAMGCRGTSARGTARRRETAILLASVAFLRTGRGEDAMAEEDTDPYKKAGTLELGLLKGRMRRCPTNVNPNCVSTSSNNDSYMQPWKVQPENLSIGEVSELIKDYMLKDPSASLVASSSSVAGTETDTEAGTGPEARYMLFDVPGSFGGTAKPDKVEFLIKSTDPRDWEGESAGLTVFFRSIAGSVKYIYPIQQPISDFGSQKKRMDALRADLGWRLSGCELIECYE